MDQAELAKLAVGERVSIYFDTDDKSGGRWFPGTVEKKGTRGKNKDLMWQVRMDEDDTLEEIELAHFEQQLATLIKNPESDQRPRPRQGPQSRKTSDFFFYNDDDADESAGGDDKPASGGKDKRSLPGSSAGTTTKRFRLQDNHKQVESGPGNGDQDEGPNRRHGQRSNNNNVADPGRVLNSIDDDDLDNLVSEAAKALNQKNSLFIHQSPQAGAAANPALPPPPPPPPPSPPAAAMEDFLRQRTHLSASQLNPFRQDPNVPSSTIMSKEDMLMFSQEQLIMMSNAITGVRVYVALQQLNNHSPAVQQQQHASPFSPTRSGPTAPSASMDCQWLFEPRRICAQYRFNDPPIGNRKVIEPARPVDSLALHEMLVLFLRKKHATLWRAGVPLADIVLEGICSRDVSAAKAVIYDYFRQRKQKLFAGPHKWKTNEGQQQGAKYDGWEEVLKNYETPWQRVTQS